MSPFSAVSYLKGYNPPWNSQYTICVDWELCIQSKFMKIFKNKRCLRQSIENYLWFLKNLVSPARQLLTMLHLVYCYKKEHLGDWPVLCIYESNKWVRIYKRLKCYNFSSKVLWFFRYFKYIYALSCSYDRLSAWETFLPRIWFVKYRY